MKRKALFVGVNDYRDSNIRNLDYSVLDANSLHDIFEELGYETDILQNPGKSDVFHAVERLTDGMTPDDFFLFYFAGHGFTDCGQHLLFCSDDMHSQLRFHRAGIPFDLLELETRHGGYGRAFLLDACRSDFLMGARGSDATARDLVAIGSMVPGAKDAPGSFYVLRSCSRYEHSLEIASRRHGLFTLALIDVLRKGRENGEELLFGESLCDAVSAGMRRIARLEGVSAVQTPEFAKSGVARVLMAGRARRHPAPDVPSPEPPKQEKPRPRPAPPPAKTFHLPSKVVNVFVNLLGNYDRIDGTCLAKSLMGTLKASGDSSWKVVDARLFHEIVEALPCFAETALAKKSEDRRHELLCWFENHSDDFGAAGDAAALAALEAIRRSITKTSQAD